MTETRKLFEEWWDDNSERNCTADWKDIAARFAQYVRGLAVAECGATCKYEQGWETGFEAGRDFQRRHSRGVTPEEKCALTIED